MLLWIGFSYPLYRKWSWCLCSQVIDSTGTTTWELFPVFEGLSVPFEPCCSQTESQYKANVVDFLFFFFFESVFSVKQNVISLILNSKIIDNIQSINLQLFLIINNPPPALWWCAGRLVTIMWICWSDKTRHLWMLPFLLSSLFVH